MLFEGKSACSKANAQVVGMSESVQYYALGNRTGFHWHLNNLHASVNPTNLKLVEKGSGGGI